MRIGILGPLEVLLDGADGDAEGGAEAGARRPAGDRPAGDRPAGDRPAGCRAVEVGGARLRALLTLLALDPGTPVPAERIIDGLWEDGPPRRAANALQSLVSRLRSVIGRDVIESRPGGYRLALPRDAVDAHDFETRVRAARRAGEPAARAAGLRAALALWRGPALADAAALRFADAPAARLEALRRAALEERVAADLELGRHAELIPELEALAADDPLREPVTALLMKALYGAGRQAEALTRYEDAKRALDESLGVDPSPELEAVYLAVLRRDASLPLAARPAAPPPSRGSSAAGGGPGEGDAADDGADVPVKGNLRARLTSFIGRDADLDRVADLLAVARLVTLIGPGGAGKTRLSVEAAERLAGRTPDGAWLAELASVTDPAEVPEAVLTALGLREVKVIRTPGRHPQAEAGEPLDRLVAALAGRRLLLVLDNCEHLLDAAARLADRVLAACPGVRILATSREPLGITGETLWPVGPLEGPQGGAPVAPAEALARPAVRLLADRAAAVAPGFAVTAGNVGPVVRICRALDGMPLAIELAAARLRSMTPAQLDRRLDDRFRLLSAGSRTALPRHRTLRAVVGWSWDLLDEAERVLWRRLAVFPGGASLESAEDVCAGPGLDRADVLDVLSALVEKSLVTVDGDGAAPGGPGHGDGPAAGHAGGFAGEDGGPRYRMLETIRAYGLERLAEAGEEDRVRRAHAVHFVGLAEAAEPRLYRADQLVWLARLVTEQDNVSAALRWAIAAADAPLALRFCAALGWYWFLHGRIVDGAEYLEEILALPGVPEDRTTALALALGAMTSLDNQREGDRVHAWLTRAQRICDRFDRGSLHPVLRLMLATAPMYTEGWHRTTALEIEGLLDDADPWVRGMAYFVHGQIAHNFGRTEQLERDFDRALAAFREAGDRWGLSFTIISQAELLGRRGDHRAAIALYEEGRELNAELGGGTSQLMHVSMRLANELDLIGERDRAEALLRKAARDIDVRRRPEELAALHYQLGELARRSGDRARARAELGRAEELTAGLPGPPQFHAMVLTSRGQLDLASGAVEEGRARLEAALRAAVRAQDYPITSYVLAGLAELARVLGDPVRAAGLLGTADGLRGARDLSQPDVADIEAAVRAELGDAAFTAAYQGGWSRTFDDVLKMFGLADPAAVTMTRLPGAPVPDEVSGAGRPRRA